MTNAYNYSECNGEHIAKPESTIDGMHFDTSIAADIEQRQVV